MRDNLFVRVLYVLVGVSLAYSAITGVVLLVTEPSTEVLVRYISSFGSIFAGLLGLCTGYLLGRQTNGNGR